MDIDIDFADRAAILSLITHVPAMMQSPQGPRRHLTGVYCHRIPHDPLTGLASIDYQRAEARGYFKIDFLNMSVYQLITDQQHFQELLRQPPPWSRLWTDPDWTQQLVHVGQYGELLNLMRPDSIERLAAFISIIRPGKAHLQAKTWTEVFDSVWDGDDSRGFIFKKSHAISYSLLVALHMNLLSQPSMTD